MATIEKSLSSEREREREKAPTVIVTSPAMTRGACTKQQRFSPGPVVPSSAIIGQAVRGE
jgi:hypothetical protein